MPPFRKKDAGRPSTAGAVGGQRYPRLSAVTDIGLKWVQAIAILAGGIWAAYHFKLAGSDNWDVTLNITTETLPYKGDLKLLVVHVESENRSQRLIELNKDTDSFKLTVRKVPDGLPESATVSTDDGEVVVSKNLLPDDDWQLLPRSKFDDTVGLVLRVNSRVSVLAKLTHDEDYVSVGKIVHVTQERAAFPR